MDAANTLPAVDAGADAAAPPQRPAVALGGPMSLGTAGRRLAHYLRPYRIGVLVAVGLFFGGAAIDPLLPALFKLLVDSGFKGDGSFPVWLVPVIVIGLFAVRGLLNFGGSYLFAWATSRAVLALRTDLVQSIMRADASLYVQLSPGVAAARVINDPQNAVNALVGALTTLLRDGTTLIALLGYLLYLNWQLTLISAALSPSSPRC